MDRRFVFFSLLFTQLLGAQEPPAEAKLYHELLLRRPQAGTMFDRFHDAWLEAAPAEDLLKFLENRAQGAEAKAADHRLLALLQARRGQDAEALKALDAALKLAPKDAEAWFEKARVQARQSDFEGALKSLEAATAAAPGEQLRVDIARQQGRALLRLNRAPEALQTWLGLAKKHPTDLDLAEDVVELMAEEGLYAEAAAEAKTLVERTKSPSEKLARQLRLGDLLLRAEKRDEALAVLEAALVQSGQDSWVEADVLSRLDQVFRREDDLDGLKQRLEALTKVHAQRVNIGLAFARVQGELGDAEAAVKLFRELLARNPGRRDLQEAYLSLLEGLDRIAEAAEQAQVLVKQHPDDKELLIHLATLEERQKRLPEAQTALTVYLEKSVVNGVAPENDHLRIARLLENWELKEEAKASYQKLVEAHPQSVSAQEALAHYLHRSKDDEAALNIWKALVQKGELEDVLRAGQALLAHGLTQEAQELLVTREKDMAEQPRFLGLLTQLALTNKQSDKAVTWSRRRLALTGEASGLQEAVKLAHQAIRDGQMAAKIIAELKGQKEMTIPDRCLLAELLEEAGQTTEAEAALQAPQATPAQQLMLSTQQVRLLEQRQDWTRAAEALALGMQLPGGMTSDRAQQLARLHRRTLAYDKALTALAEWKKLSPGAVQPWLEESAILMEQAKQSAALDVLRAASRKFSDDTDVMSTLAAALAAAGKMEEARTAYMALYEQTEDPVAKLRFLTPLAQMSQYSGALPRLLEEFQQRQRQNRASALPWLALATLHAATNNDEERRRCLYEASRLRPKDLGLLTEIARIEEENGLYEAALRTLNAAAPLDSSSATRQKIAALMIENGDEEAGYRLIFELAGVSTASARAIETMADTLCEHGQWHRAISLLEPLLPRFPTDYRLHYLKAVALEEEGRQDEAIAAFVHLMSLHEELPEVLAAPPAANAQQPQSFSLELPSLPPGTAEWLQLPNVSYLAYQHRQKQRGSYGQIHGYMQMNRPAPGALPSGWVQQPANVTNLSAMALYHLVEMGQGLKVDERASLVRHMEAAGIRDSALLLEVPVYEGQLGIPPDLLETHPDHQALHALWLMHVNQFQGDLLPGLKRCVALFKDSYPLLAFQAGMAALALHEPEGDALAGEVLANAKNLPEADNNAMSYLLGAVQRRLQTSASGPPLPAGLAEQVMELTTEWSKSLYREQGSNQRPWSGYSLIMLFVALENWEGVANLLEKENAVQLSSKPPLVQQQRYPSGHFEPQPLPAMWSGLDVAPSMMEIVQQLLRGRNGLGFSVARDPFSSSEVEDSEDVDADTQAALKKMTAGLKTPGLKLLLSCMRGLEEGKAGLAELMKQPDLKTDNWLFAATLAQSLQDFPLQIACLREVSARKPDAMVQQTVDNALIFGALQVVNSGSALTPEIKPAVLASFERRRTTLPASPANGYLVDVAATLGFTEQMEVMTKAAATRQPSAQASRSSNNPYSRRQNQTQQGPYGKLDKLLADQNQAAVFTEFQQQVGRIGDLWFGVNWGNADNELQALRGVLDKRQATGRLMEELKAAPKTGWQSLQRAAAFFELMGHDQTAVETYEATLALRPRNWEVRSRLALLLARKDVEKALPHLAAIPRLELRQALQRICQEISPRSYSGRVFEHRLAVIRLMTAYVEKHLDPKRRLDPALISQFSQMPNYIQQGEYNDLSFPALYETNPPREALSDAAKKVRDQLRSAHDAFCLALMKIPMLAQSGFGPYAGLAEKDGQPPEKLETLAREILNRQILARRHAPNLGYWFGRSPSRYGGQSNQIAMPQPEDILLRVLVARHEEAKIETELLPLIRKASGPAAEKQMRAYTWLLTCPEAEFLTAARIWNRSQEEIGSASGYQEITRIWAERRFSTPIHDIYLEKLKSRNFNVQMQQMAGYMQILAKAGKMEDAATFLNQARNILLGKEEEERRKSLAEFVSMQDSPNRRYGMYNPNAAATRWQIYLSLLSEVIRQGPAAHVGIRLAREDGLLDEPGLFSQICGNLFDESLIQGPASDMVAVLDELRLLARAEDFRLWFSQKGQNYTAMQTFLGRMDDSSPNVKKARDLLIETLQKRQPQTFGTDLVVTLLSNQSSAMGPPFSEFLKRRSKELPSLSSTAKHEMSALISRNGYNLMQSLDAEARTMLEPLTEAQQERSVQMAEVILAATTWEQAKLEEYNTDERLLQIIRDVAVTDPDKAARVLKHSVGLLKQTLAQLQNNSANGGPVFDLLVQMGQVPKLMNITLDLAQKEGLSSTWTSRYTYAMEEGNSLNQPQHVLAMFQDTPFVAEAKDFRGLTIPGRSEGSALVRMCGILRSSSYRPSAAVLTKDLQGRNPKTFGVRLTLALLDNAPKALEDFLISETEALGQLPGAEASGLLVALGARDSMYRMPHRLTESLQTALAPLFEAQAADDKAVLEAFLEAPTLQAGDRAPGESEELAAKLRRYVRRRPKEALPIFEKLTLLFAAESRSQNNLVHTPLAYWLRQCAQIPELFGTAMQRAETEGLMEERDWMNSLYGGLNEGQQLQDAASLVTLLKGSPFLGQSKDFRAYPMTGSSEGSVLGYVVAQMQRKKELREAVLKGLQDNPDTFGHALLLSLLHEQPRMALLKFLKDRQEDVAEMTPETRQGFDLLIETEMSPLIVYDQDIPVLKELLKKQKQKAEDTRKTLLTLSHEQAIQDRSGNNLLATDLALVTQHDPKGAQEVFKHLVGVIARTEPDLMHRRDARSSKMGAFLQSLKLDPGLWPLMSKEARSRGFFNQPEWSQWAYCGSYMDKHETDVVSLRDAFVRSGLLNEASAFDPLPGLGGPTYSSLLHYLSVRLHQFKTRAEVESILKSEKQRTFGVDLLSTLVALNRDQALNDFATRRGEELAQMPGETQALILAAVENHWTSLKYPEELPDEVQKVLQRIQESRRKEEDVFMESLLKATSLQDLKLPDSNLTIPSKKLIQKLVKEKNLTQAVWVFEKTCELMEARREGGVSDPYQQRPSPFARPWMSRSSFLLDCINARDSSVIAFGLKVLNADRTGQLHGDAWVYDYGWGQHLQQSWHELGGRAAPVSSLQALMEELNEQLKGESLAVMAMVFHNWMPRLGRSDIQAFLQWTEKLPKDHSCHALAKELQTAARLYLEASPEGVGPSGTCAIRGHAAHAPLWQHYVATLTDEKLNPRLRLALGNHLCYKYPWAVPADVVMPLAKLAAMENRDQNIVKSFVLANVLRCFNQLPMTPEWRSTAEILWEGWMKRQGNRQVSLDDNETSNPVLGHTFALLQLAGRLKKDEWIDTLLNVQAPSLQQYRSIVAILVDAGHPQKAASLLKANHARMYAWQSGIYTWHPDMRKNLPAFQKACEDPGLALLGEMIVLQASDPHPALLRAFKNKETLSQRIATLAPKVLKTAFRDESTRMHAVSIVANYAPLAALDLMGDYCAQEAKKISIDSLITMEDSGERAMKEYILSVNFIKQALAGKPETWLEAIETLAHHSSTNGYTSNSSLADLIRYPADMITALWERGEARDAKKWLPILEKIITLCESRAGPHTGVAVSYAYVLATQTEGGLQAWKKKRSPAELKLCERSLEYLDIVYETAAAFVGAPDSKKRMTHEQRLDIVLDLLADGRRGNSYAIFAKLKDKHRLLTMDEMLAKAEVIQTFDTPYGAKTFQIIECAINEGQSARVLPLFDLMLAKKDPNGMDKNVVGLRKAALLIRLGKKAEAASVLVEISQTKPKPYLQKELDSLKKILETAQ
ncbi:MAG: tetratricopeptide repeat protein [Verrucomicrobiota bacterium]